MPAFTSCLAEKVSLSLSLSLSRSPFLKAFGKLFKILIGGKKKPLKAPKKEKAEMDEVWFFYSFLIISFQDLGLF
jgi:hypothetical protein